MDRDTREIALSQQLVEFISSSNGFHEDYNLCKLVILVQLELFKFGVLDWIRGYRVAHSTSDSWWPLQAWRRIVEARGVWVLSRHPQKFQAANSNVSYLRRKKPDKHTLVMNFLQVTRISFASVALNIITCLWWGVTRNISWTSRRISEDSRMIDGMRTQSTEGMRIDAKMKGAARKPAPWATMLGYRFIAAYVAVTVPRTNSCAFAKPPVDDI